MNPKYNPCDQDSHPALAPIGNFFAKFSSGCPCCDGARILGALIAGFAFGAALL